MVAPLNISLPSIGFLPTLQVLDRIDHSFHRITVHAVSSARGCAVGCAPAMPRHGGMPTAAPASSIHSMVIRRIAGGRVAGTPRRGGGTSRSAGFRAGTASCGIGGPRAGEAVRAPDRTTEEDRRFVRALRERSPSLATAADFVTRFCGMVKGESPDPFENWLREAEASTLTPFAAGIRRDEDAVRAALSEPWSSGQAEGQVNRLKATKRTMYGRAGFDRLRARVLALA